MTLQDMILVVQMETKSGSESKIKPADWLRWAMDSITEACLIDGCLRIQSSAGVGFPFTTIASPYSVDPDADPSTGAYNVPASLLPYHVSLESYIKFRYHSSDPKNETESAEASKAYQEFLRGLGVQGSAPAKG